jgi:hypothetical protein
MFTLTFEKEKIGRRRRRDDKFIAILCAIYKIYKDKKI